MHCLASGAWRGDVLYIYAGPAGETVWMWMLELGAPNYADDLKVLTENTSGLEVAATEKRVTLIGGDARPQFVLDAAAAFLL